MAALITTLDHGQTPVTDSQINQIVSRFPVNSTEGLAAQRAALNLSLCHEKGKHLKREPWEKPATSAYPLDQKQCQTNEMMGASARQERHMTQFDGTKEKIYLDNLSRAMQSDFQTHMQKSFVHVFMFVCLSPLSLAEVFAAVWGLHFPSHLQTHYLTFTLTKTTYGSQS